MNGLILVRPCFLYKNQRADRTPHNIIIEELWNGDTRDTVCQVEALRTYIQESQGEDRRDAVFLHPISGRKLQRSSVTRKLGQEIDEVCPGSLPGTHDVRKPATLLAWCRGIKPKQLVAWAFWASASTFITRYLSAQG